MPMIPSLPGEQETTADRFEAVTMPFVNLLYGKAVHLARSPEDASDLVQETYLRAFRTFSNFTHGTNCKAWLFTILYSVFINQYRKARREPELVSMDDSAMDTSMEAFHQKLAGCDYEAGFATRTSSADAWQGPEVHEALEKLPKNFRSAVLLVDVDGLNYEEAAGALNCPTGTLRSRLFRARKRLFVDLRDYAQKMGFPTLRLHNSRAPLLQN